MNNNPRLRLALQKSGRLSKECISLLEKCGLKIQAGKSTLLYRVPNFPLDLLMVRDDDIPSFVSKGVCDAGIVGEDVYLEQLFSGSGTEDLDLSYRLGLAKCRLCLAVPENSGIENAQQLNGLRLATSFPGITQKYMSDNNIKVQLVEMEGSVEVAPQLHIADAIADLVSTGATLVANGMRLLQEIQSSEAILIKKSKNLSDEKLSIFNRLLTRIQGVLSASESKYIMLHAPEDSVQQIRELLPGAEAPTTLTLPGIPGKVAIHAVCQENIFWETMEELKKAGASAILVLPIEKMMV